MASKELPYPCIICKKRFKLPSEVGKHVEAEHIIGNKGFDCDTCGEDFPDKKTLLKHKQSHMKESGEKPYLCSYCLKPFALATQRQKHEQAHLNNKKIQCKDCLATFRNKSLLEEHRQTNNCVKESLICCGKTFANRKEFVLHKKDKSHQKGPQDKTHECKYCGRTFAYFAYKRDHEKKHIGKDGTITRHLKAKSGRRLSKKNKSEEGKMVKCDLCDEEFDGRYQMYIHRRTHPNAKTDFPCLICGKVLKTKSARHLHTQNHTGKKKHQCTYCERSFTSKQNLILHTRTHTKERPLVCRFCGKTFAHPTPFASHERGHTGETPYECSFCNRKFTRFGSWQSHVRLHTGEKPYQCKHCEKKFAQHSTWASHEKTHTMSPSQRRRKKPNQVKQPAEPIQGMISLAVPCPPLQQVTQTPQPIENYSAVHSQWLGTYETAHSEIYTPQMMNNSWVG